MKSCTLLVLLWVLTYAGWGQSPQPGGVKGAVQWYSTDTAVATPGPAQQDSWQPQPAYC